MKKIIQILMMAVLMLAITGYSHAQTGVPITINPSPTQYAVTGGGAYCAGGVGLPVGLAGSQVGVVYTLLYNGATIVSQINGTGSALTFGLQTNGGTYTIEGVNATTSCDILMTGSATITVNAIPNINLTASGPVEFCGSGSVTLTATANITTAAYQWYKNGVIISGTNNNTYTASQAGMYSVVVTNPVTGCNNDASQMVEIHPLPQQFVVSASSTTFCQGSMTTINQNGSHTGVNYQLFLNGSQTGSPVVGTGNALAWSVNTAGTYTVQATDATTGCQSMMSGSATVTMNPLPAAAGTISGPTQACQGETLTYSIAPITGATSYSWGVPTWTTIIGGQGTSQITLLVLESGVSGNVTVFGQNNCGTGPASSRPLTVNNSPTVNVVATPHTICVGESSNINAGGNGTAFLWSTGATTQNISVTPNATTTYTVTVTGSNGCTTSQNATVTVHQSPSVTLNLPQTVFCGNDADMLLTGGSPAGGTYVFPYIYQGYISPANTPHGTYMIEYHYTNPQTGCSGTASQAIQFNPVTIPVIVPVSGPIYINTPAFPLSGMPSGGVWTGPGMNGNMFTPAAAGVGTHTIMYHYTHPVTGCVGAEMVQMVVLGEVNCDLFYVGATATPGQLCEGESTQLGTQISGGTGVVYAWSSTPSGFVSAANAPVVQPTATTTYTVTVTDTNGCTSVGSVTVTVHTAPTVMFVPIIGTIYTNSPNIPLIGYVTPQTGVFSGTGVVGGNIFNPAIAGPGTHTITYTIIGNNGCIGSRSQDIVVHSVNNIATTTAVNAVAIFPNPATEQMNICEIDTQEIISLQVLDLMGRVLYSKETLEKNMQLNVASFSPGTYLIRFINAEGFSQSKRFVKR